MEITRVERFQETDRNELMRMLHESHDFPPQLVHLYRRGRSSYPAFVAWRGNALVGLLDGVFNMNFGDSRDFDEFDLPATPHALVERIYVQPSAREDGVGSLLMATFAIEASWNGCAFIGGSLDLASDTTVRRRFFERCGFTLSRSDTFGALTNGAQHVI